MKQLDYTIFPSDLKTIAVEQDDIYGGAHRYQLQNSRGFENGQAVYGDSHQIIQFVKKQADEIRDGIQSEQLAYVLLDRAIKLNAVYPSAQNEKMIAGLNMFLSACKERIEDRLSRGVMGELKK